MEMYGHDAQCHLWLAPTGPGHRAVSRLTTSCVPKYSRVRCKAICLAAKALEKRKLDPSTAENLQQNGFKRKESSFCSA